MSGSGILEVQNLTKEFGGLTAVDGISFQVNEGEILGIIGPNGAGKSTVFNCIMNELSLTDGAVSFQGERIDGWDVHDVVNAGIARVSQESNPIDTMDVHDNIKLFTLPNSLSAFREGASEEEIRSIADRVGLGDSLDMLPGSLPHADRRRLEIAKALATDPDLLMLDEPFAGLTQEEVEELSAEIEQLRSEDITVVVVDHNMSGLMALVDRIVVLHWGEILTEGSPSEVAENTAVQEAYLTGEIEEGDL